MSRRHDTISLLSGVLSYTEQVYTGFVSLWQLQWYQNTIHGRQPEHDSRYSSQANITNTDVPQVRLYRKDYVSVADHHVQNCTCQTYYWRLYFWRLEERCREFIKLIYQGKLKFPMM